MTGSVFASDSMQWRMSAGRQHPDVPPQHTAAAAVVRHGDDGGQIFRVFFQPAQHGGKARAAADGDDMPVPAPTADGSEASRSYAVLVSAPPTADRRKRLFDF